MARSWPPRSKLPSPIPLSSPSTAWTVTLTLYDTLRETTTILIQTNNDGDTTRLISTTDREKIKNSDRTADHSHHITQIETTSNTEKTTTPIKPIRPINPTTPIKPIAISFLLGLLLIPLIKLRRHIKK